MKIYNEIVTAQTVGRKCHYCGEKVERGTQYLHMARNRHIFNICGKCLVVLATKIHNPERATGSDGILSSAFSKHRNCNQCEESVSVREKFLHIERNRHHFVLCGDCLESYANQIMEIDPIHKADAMAELI